MARWRNTHFNGTVLILGAVGFLAALGVVTFGQRAGNHSRPRVFQAAADWYNSVLDRVDPYRNRKTKAIVSGSARGWTLRVGPRGATGYPTTIIVNPLGQEFNIGETQYPDILPATLWIVPVKELNARFLLIRVPPACSAGPRMPVLNIDNLDRPTLAAAIQQHFEFPPNPGDLPGAQPMVDADGKHPLRDILFEDADTNGVPLLFEDDFWQLSGTKTYFKFTSLHTFVPVRIEKYDYVCDESHPNGGYVMSKRENLPFESK